MSAPPDEAVQQSAASQAMARYAQGEDAAFAAVYDALAPRLYAYLRRRLGDQATAEDVLQQVFMQMHLHRGRFIPGARVEPWAYAIARCLAIDSKRSAARRTRREQVEDSAVNVVAETDALYAAKELAASVDEELASLSPALREAFLLVRLEGLSHADAAAVLGIEPTALRVRTHRATDWLRTRLRSFLTGREPDSHE